MTNSILVTGASTGLGLETALYLAERDFKVYGTVLSLSDRDKLDEEMKKRNVSVEVLQMDITDPEGIDNAMSTIYQQSGGIFGLINNAGIGLRGYFEDLSDEEIRQVFNVNVLGTMAVTRAALKYMRPARRGRIVIISSVGGKSGAIGVSAYCSTKFAQEGFGESLALEVLPFGICVSLIEPAIIKTERWGVNRGNAQRALDPESPYCEWFRESERLADRLVETSPTKPVDVARTIHTALTARRPKLRYMVGTRARLVFALRRYLPGELFERIYFSLSISKVTKPQKAQGV